VVISSALAPQKGELAGGRDHFFNASSRWAVAILYGHVIGRRNMNIIIAVKKERSYRY
jgi:hypothetical protein